MLTPADYTYFANRALDGMAGIVEDLGDDLANRKPDLPGANSPYALLTHCLGVVEYWAGALIAGREVVRDRAAEFTAAGPVAPLLERARTVCSRFAEDVRHADPSAPLRALPPVEFEGPGRRLTQAAALQHIFEELAQHHGQMQVLRDAILRETGERATTVDLARLRGGFGVKWGLDDDVLNAWVADMDFGIPGPVRDRLAEVVRREDFGYPHWPGGDPVVLAFENRMVDEHAWSPRPGRTRVFTDLIQILQVVIEHATEPGDGIALHVPNYPPFLASVHRAGRRIVPLPVERDAQGWQFPVDELAQRLRSEQCRMLLLVNPHNPTGRVFRADELRAFAEVSRELDLVVLADEIHADLAYPGHRHIAFASLDDDTASRTITATSATKAFNLAAARCAVAQIGPDRVWEALERAPFDYFGTPSLLSRVATVAAWTESDGWRRTLLRRLAANRARMAAWRERSSVDFALPEASYLAWLDFTGTALRQTDPAEEILRSGGVRLSPGAEFAAHTQVDTRRFARLNFATSVAVLDSILDRIDGVLAR